MKTGLKPCATAGWKLWATAEWKLWATAGLTPCATQPAGACGRYELGSRKSLHGARVVLVDDVSTTGATLDACAVVLKDAGAREVYALTAARVVSKPL